MVESGVGRVVGNSVSPETRKKVGLKIEACVGVTVSNWVWVGAGAADEGLDFCP